MTTVHVGDRVVVVAQWSEFRGKRARVTQLVPHCMVVVEGDRFPIRVGVVSLAFESDEVIAVDLDELPT